MTEETLRFSYNDEIVDISYGDPFFSANINAENMAVYLLLGRTLLSIQQFENNLSFTLSILQMMKMRVTPPKTLNDSLSELRENNSRLTLGRIIAKLADHISDQNILDELRSIKNERNQLVHHFWRVLDWPFQNEGDVRREFELAEHLSRRMALGEFALAEHVRSSDKRIKIHFGAVDPNTKKIVMEDGSEATRVKE
jgi:hypothetical protein